MRPGRTFFITASALLVLGAAVYFMPFFLKIWLWSLPVIGVFATFDAIILVFWTDRLNVARKMNTIHAIGHAETVELILSCTKRSIQPGKIRVFDMYDEIFDCDAFPAALTAPAFGETISFFYELLPVQRGNWKIPACELMLSSTLHFWRLKVRHEVYTEGRVYPDFKLLAAQGSLDAVIELAGQKTVRKRGTGIEFERLREWQNGDSVRAIDWRATGRRGKLILREYIEEQDQQVLFMLDTGYRLHRPETRRTDSLAMVTPQFDSALNAALFLAWAALKHGDAVAGALFGGMERWIPPRRGPGALSGLMNALYDAKSAPCPSSIFTALETALNRLKRRTFIVLVSSFREEDEEALSMILHRAGKQHLLLLANVEEAELENLQRHHSPLISAAAQNYRNQRIKLMTRWERQGFLTLECPAAALTAALLNSYLKVKRSGAL